MLARMPMIETHSRNTACIFLDMLENLVAIVCGEATPRRLAHAALRWLARLWQVTNGSTLHLLERLFMVLSSSENRQREPMGSYTTRTGITPSCRQ